jgi:chemotaxis signal transduction protein
MGGLRHVLGIAQLRGEVLSLVDLFEALVGQRSEIGQWIVVLQGRGGRTAAPVSEVLGSRSVLEDELVPEGQVPALCPAIIGTTRDLWHLLDAAAVTAALDAELVESDELQRSS